MKCTQLFLSVYQFTCLAKDLNRLMPTNIAQRLFFVPVPSSIRPFVCLSAACLSVSLDGWVACDILHVAANKSNKKHHKVSNFINKIAQMVLKKSFFLSFSLWRIFFAKETQKNEIFHIVQKQTNNPSSSKDHSAFYLNLIWNRDCAGIQAAIHRTMEILRGFCDLLWKGPKSDCAPKQP